MIRADVIATLNDLIVTSKDGENGFQTCADAVKDLQLNSFCTRKAEQCRTSAAQLQDIVREMGGDPVAGGSTSGALHRAWVDIRSAITGMDEHAILAECERGEDTAKKAYEEALRQDLPGDVRLVVQRQYDGLKANHDRIKELRNATA